MKQQLMQQWIKLSTKLDALTLRERAMVFLAVTAAVLFVIYTLSVEPMLTRQKVLLGQIAQQDNQIAGIDDEISSKAQAFALDPDAAVREHLRQVRREMAQTSDGLMAVQKGLVAPEKITPLLEHLLRVNGKLRLVSLKTLPVTGLSEAALPPPGAASAAEQASGATGGSAGAASAAANGTATAPLAAVVGALTDAGKAQGAASAAQGAVVKPRELLYRHGVEIVLQGSYLDMVSYMEALESLPVQLFWGKAALDAQQYPNLRLTLTLYTLSLDAKWMKL